MDETLKIAFAAIIGAMIGGILTGPYVIPFLTSLHPNSQPYFESLSADFESPQPAGSMIKWTAKATDQENDDLRYRFLLKTKYADAVLETSPWSCDNNWIWDTYESDSGDYVVEVWVRDGHHATGIDETDDYICKRYKLIEGHRIIIDNQCSSEISIILRYNSPSVGWTTEGPWIIEPHTSSSLLGGESDSEDIRSIDTSVFYYAYSKDKNNFKWEGDYHWEYNGKSIGMRHIQPYVDNDNDYVITLTCS